MDRPRRNSRQHNGITVRGLPQPTFATKSANSGNSSAGCPHAEPLRKPSLRFDALVKLPSGSGAMSEMGRHKRTCRHRFCGNSALPPRTEVGGRSARSEKCQIQKGRATGQSALPSRTDVAGRACQVGKVPSTEVSARRPCIGTLPLHRASTPNASTVGVHLMSFSGTDTRRVGFP